MRVESYIFFYTGKAIRYHFLVEEIDSKTRHKLLVKSGLPYYGLVDEENDSMYMP